MILPTGSAQSRARLIEDNEIPPLPEGWDVQRFRFLFKESKERNGDAPVGDMLSVSEYRGVVPKEYEHEEQRRTNEELQTYRVVRPGQLAVNTMWLNHLGLGMSDHLGHVSPAYAVYDISPELDQRFVHHLLRSQYYLKIYLRYLYGIRPNSFQIKADDWNSIPVILPPRSAQKAIADFLDRETAHIDQLIEKKKELQSIIKLKSQALLERYFTFGLVADRQRKATGLSWLPTIPASWEITAIKRVVKVKDGTHETPRYVDADEHAFPLITSKDFIDQSIDFSNAKYISAQDHELIYRRSNTEKGDVLMSMIGGNIGKSILVTDAREFSIKNVALFKTSGNQRLARQILLFLRSPLFAEQLRLLGRGGAQDFIGLGDIRNLMFPIIPRDELDELVSEAGEKIAGLTEISERIQLSIARLQEFRSALITAAVTGQIDVATWGKQGQTDRRLDQIEEAMQA